MSDMNATERWYAYGDENGDGPWNEGSDPDYEVGICQNCDTALPRERVLRGTLFCSEKCQQTAEVVRYGRATLRDGRYQRDPLVREALETRIASSWVAVTQRRPARSPASNEKLSLREMADVAVSVAHLPLI